MITLLSRAALAAAAMALGLSGAHAATANGNLSVKMTVTAACQVGSTTLDFGNQSSLTNGTVSANGSIPITCTSGTGFTIALDNGQNGDDTGRFMSDGAGHKIAYTIYDGTDQSIPWTSTHIGSGGVRTGTSYNATINAKATMSNAVAGNYSDTVLITVNY